MNKIIDFLSSPKIFFYNLIWLGILLTVGTISQKFIGLHQSQVLYFSSWIAFFGPVPVPGGRLALTVMFVNLLSKLLFKSPFVFKRSGVIITHLGSLLLLLGGFFTAIASREGNMVLHEGATSNFFSDHYAKELAIIDTSDRSLDHVLAFSGSRLQPGAVLEHERLPGTITILDFYTNTKPLTRIAEAPQDTKGLAMLVSMKEDALSPEDRNLAGVRFRWDGIGSESGTYVAPEALQLPQDIEIDGKSYRIELRGLRHFLPIALTLNDFEKQVHPGTQKPRSFKSEVDVRDGNSTYPAIIQMNQPLRTHNFTFYQSSFVQDRFGETSIFSVVENAGRLFPYISSIIIAIGIFWHILVTYIPKLTKKKAAEKKVVKEEVVA